MSAQEQGTNEVPTCHGGLENLDAEHDYWIDDIEGSLPSDLVGTFVRNGPGRQRIGNKPYGHWFDGDGMLSQFTFSGSQVHFRNRYIRTPKYIEETSEQKILYRGFGTQIPGGFLKNMFRFPANPANTSIVYHGSKFLALNEGGRPWEVEPGSLDTVGEYDYEGSLKGKSFSAHGKVHPRSGEYFNFGVGMSGSGIRKSPCLNLYRISPEGKMSVMSEIPLETFPFCHDFALSDRYGIYFINSILFGGMRDVILGTASMSDGIRYGDDVPMRIIVVDLESLQVVKQFETDPGAIIHFGNAFEEGDEIILDAMFQDNFDANQTLSDVFSPEARFGGGQYNRYHLNLKDGTLSCEKISPHESEFPVFNPKTSGKRHSVCWTACSVDNGANSFFNGIQRVSYDGESQLVTLPMGKYGSEPMFAPSVNAKNEDDGYLLDVVYDGFEHKSELQIFRADNLDEQVCVLRLPHHLPHQFHGQFIEKNFSL